MFLCINNLSAVREIEPSSKYSVSKTVIQLEISSSLQDLKIREIYSFFTGSGISPEKISILIVSYRRGSLFGERKHVFKAFSAFKRAEFIKR